MRAAIDLAQAETRLAQLVQEASEGTEIVITDQGRPVARLLSITESLPDRIPGSARGRFTVPDDFDTPLESEPPIRKRGMGMDRGLGWVSDDFDAPLPEELERMFSGLS